MPFAPSADEPAEHDRVARDRDRAQLVEVAALDLLDEEQRGHAERRRQQERDRQLEGGVSLALEEVGRLRREDLGRLAGVHHQEEERDEHRHEQRVRLPQRLAQPALSQCDRGAHALTSWTSPAARSRVRPVASRKTSSSVGSSSPPRRSRRSALSCSGVPSPHDAAAVDDRDAVAELVGLLEVLRREEHRRAVPVDPAQLLPDRQPAGRVEDRWSARRGRAPRARGRAPPPGRAGAACRRSSP